MSYSYEYDNYGNRTAKTYYYGSNIIQSYEWERGRLLKNIKNTSGGVVGAYTYDVNGVRYTKTADGVTTTYFYDGNTLLGENRSDGTRLRYFYDATGLCGFSYYNSNETKYYTYVKDVLGNIVMIKDDMGLPLVKYTYNEWGVCSMTAFNLDNQGAAALELGNLNPFRYRGYYYDSESGLYYLMSRYYDTQIGRFISPDTADYLAPDTIGGVDLYAYGLNNPVMYVDPTGHVAVTTAVLIGLGIGIALGFGTVAMSDYMDDGVVFNGSVEWYKYVNGSIVGGVLGGLSGYIIAVGGPVLNKAIESAVHKFISDVFAYAFSGVKFGTWEDYAFAFVSGGLLEYAQVAKNSKTAYDVFWRPMINQVIKIGTNRQNKFKEDKYIYDFITRGLTTNCGQPQKAIIRGVIRAAWTWWQYIKDYLYNN